MNRTQRKKKRLIYPYHWLYYGKQVRFEAWLKAIKRLLAMADKSEE